MRGKAFTYPCVALRYGITPAHAGKRSKMTHNYELRRDHPRTCGEKEARQWPKEQVWGSPPHMRGKALPVLLDSPQPWITPAHAGKSAARNARASLYRDHPRTCGEKSHSPVTLFMAMGSPPHMRGKVRVLAVHQHTEGITPAHAGKRLKRSRSIVPHAAIVPLFPSVCNKPAGSDGSPAGHDAPPFLPIENAAPASPAYNLRSL